MVLIHHIESWWDRLLKGLVKKKLSSIVGDAIFTKSGPQWPQRRSTWSTVQHRDITQNPKQLKMQLSKYHDLLKSSVLRALKLNTDLQPNLIKKQ